jgi:hypothetical protein
VVEPGGLEHVSGHVVIPSNSIVPIP